MADLTRNQSLVLETLTASEAPLSAYEILERLRVEGLRAPLQIYRALEKLISVGQVHRLESLNAFVACRHPGCEARSTIAFAICDGCGAVSEISDDALTLSLKDLAKAAAFKPSKSTVELRGRCQKCQEGA